MTNYSMENRTYRYFPGEPLYPFGYGLSYTAFNYTSLVASPSSVAAGKDISLTVGLQNVGKYKGDEVRGIPNKIKTFLNNKCLGVPLEIIVSIYDTLDNNFGIKKDFTNYL